MVHTNTHRTRWQINDARKREGRTWGCAGNGKGEKVEKRSNADGKSSKEACPLHLWGRAQQAGGGPVIPTFSRCRLQSTTSDAYTINKTCKRCIMGKNAFMKVADTHPPAAWCVRRLSHERSFCTQPRSSTAHYKHIDRCPQLLRVTEKETKI